jgi:hypothetical protein
MSNRVSAIIADDYLNQGMQIESAGKPNAAATSSTAAGLFQFLNQSWLGILHDHGPDNIRSRIKKVGGKYTVPDGGMRSILDMRKAGNDPAKLKLNIDMGARLWEDNARALGKGWGNGDLYLAHFLGVGTAKKVLRADPNATAVSVCGQGPANANPTIFYVYNGKVRGRAKTVAELRSWAFTAMNTRWERAGKPDWIGKYYPKEQEIEVAPEAEQEDDDKPPMKVDVPEDSEPEAVPLPTPRPPTAPTAPPLALPNGVTIKGDPETWWIQYRLKAMNYSTGLLDGRYGGKTTAGLAAFLNDRGSKVPAPTSADDFLSSRELYKAELSAAEAAGFVRPVTQERKDAKPEVVNEAAPEAKPIRRNFTFGWLGAIGSLITAFFQWAGDSLSEVWNFWTSNKDSLPDSVKDPSTIQWLWGKISGLPATVWLMVAALVFIFFALNAGSGLKQIIDKVKTGER